MDATETNPRSEIDAPALACVAYDLDAVASILRDLATIAETEGAINHRVLFFLGDQVRRLYRAIDEAADLGLDAPHRTEAVS